MGIGTTEKPMIQVLVRAGALDCESEELAT